MKSFPQYRQSDTMDCGPTCLRIIAKFYGKNFTLQKLRDICEVNREGTSLMGISHGAEKIGFRANAVRLSTSLLGEINLPCILFWQQKHFVILYKIKKSKYYISDPAKGLISYTHEEFIENWSNTRDNGNEVGIALTLETTPDFYSEIGDKDEKLRLTFLLSYLRSYKQLIVQLFVGLAVGSILQLILPFLTQSIVDTGINTRNIHFIYVILIAQTMLLLGRLSVEFLRSWILLHISTRINISILTDFMIKLMKLPMSFFDTRMTGDIMQRISDQGRIQNFLTGTTLNVVFSLFNLFVFALVLLWYNTTIFFIFLISSFLYSIWVILFLKKRRDLDNKRFDISSENQSAIVQLIAGMQEIKLNNSEQQKRWEWERLQAGLFKFSIKSLSIGQIQTAGAFFINESKNILITFIVAKAVIDGNLTLGGMMAIQYVIGQLNAPIEQMLGFIQQLQDTKISLERLNEIHSMEDEESSKEVFVNEMPSNRSIELKNITFNYPGVENEPVLANIDLYIPQGKTTAIVGMSGSGKTTILKLLLRFYKPRRGEIRIGRTNLSEISYRFWRSECGMVMQDGFIFSDSIANNIAVGDEYPDLKKLQHAIMVANINEFVDSLPLGLNTKIGAEGNGISQGQRQRILIARAVYKDPEYIFFDEATSSLDANNEKVIMENLEHFFKGKTVVIVAHRLSTVKNADKIVMLQKGKIIEQGSHLDLIKTKGEYFKLVKNQLEIGN